jgi:hypothetical protein
MSEPSDGRKERVIHARVPESLDDEIRRRAGSLGLSVSNLVRNVLQNTFGLVEDIVADGAEIARAARFGRHREVVQMSALPAASARLLGWQSARLAINAVCESCNALLPAGSQAAIGVSDGAAPPRFRCEACVDGAAHAAREKSDER